MGLLMPFCPFQILVAMRSEASGDIFWVAGRVTVEHGRITIGFERDVPPFKDQPPGPWRATVEAVIETPQRGWQRGTPAWPDNVPLALKPGETP